MQRVTVTLDADLMADLDRVIERRGYQNRSEAIRDLARAGLREAAESRGESRECVAALVYVYEHEARQLSKRLIRSFHDHHALTLSAMHVHLDHESCLEVAVLRGPTRDVQRLADHVTAERGVRHGRLVMMPVDVERTTHAHGDEPGRPHLHVHVK